MGCFTQTGSKLLRYTCLIVMFFSIGQAHASDIGGDIIIDNDSAGTSATGKWQLSSGPNSYGTQSLYSREIGATYRYATFMETGIVQMSINLWWTKHKNRSSNVMVEIKHNSGTSKIFVDQTKNAGQWFHIGTWFFDGESSVTIHSNTPNKSTSVDAVLFEVTNKGSGASSAEIFGEPETKVSINKPYDFRPSTIAEPGFDWLHFRIKNKPVWASFDSRTGALTGTPVRSSIGTTKDIVISVSNEDFISSLPAFNLTVVEESAIIIDNNDPETSFTGKWQLSSGPNSYGTQSLYSREMGAKYNYTFIVPETGSYDVKLWWTNHRSRSSKVLVAMYADGEPTGVLKSAEMDQTKNGGQWNTILRMYLTKGYTNKLSIFSNTPSKSTSVDAIQLVLNNEKNTVTVDNNDLETSSSGEWLLSSGPNSYGTQSLYSRDPGAKYTYRLTVPKTGDYDIDLWWTKHHNRSNKVSVEISAYDESGMRINTWVTYDGVEEMPTLKAYVDQTKKAGQWNMINTVHFGKGTEVVVDIISGSRKKSTSVDAVQLIYQPEYLY